MVPKKPRQEQPVIKQPEDHTRNYAERKLLENTKALLNSSEEKYRALVENINDVLLLLDTLGNITYISPVVEQFSNYKVSDLIGKTFTQLIYPDDLPALLDRFTLLLSGELEPWEFRVVDQDGSVIFVRTSSRPLYKDGEVVGITTLLTDITVRKKIEERLSESELRYRDLVNFSKNGVAVYEAVADGEDFIIKDFNQAAESIENVKKEDIIGKSLLQVFPGVKEFGLIEVLQRVLRTGVPERHPLTWYHDERISGWRDSYVYRLPSGEIVAIYEDITERKQAEEALRSQQMMLARTEGIAHIGSWEWDIATDTVIWSNELFRIFQRDPQEGAPSFAEHPALYHPEDMARLQKAVEVTVADGTTYELELRAIRKDGETRVCMARGFAEMALNGRAVRLFGSLQDITERKQVEEELEKSRQELRNLSVHLISLREEERTLLAREIHDELGQALTALKMDLSWLSKKSPEGNGPLAEKTASMLKLIDITVKTVKRLATELRPGLLDDLGLVAAMEWQAGEFQERTGIKTILSFEPDDIMVDNEQATALFRIFQEVLTNVVRHAAATRVDAYLRENDGLLELSVRDNGKGIEQKMINSSKSLGLIGMRERCHHLGGTVDIRGKPGKGTTVTVNLPAGEVR